MKKPTAKYSKSEIGRLEIVEDFLPSPDKLVLRENNVKVTLSLSQRSVAFFKRAARQRRVTAVAFHTELGHDERLHRLFLSDVAASRGAGSSSTSLG